ncbi:MAG: DUF262 domain-containing protein [Christensenellaceae bacterium]|jgi:hypothetical protein|nr:DUF262 domain-containing protein [Christensenellaceae bacterium]
MSLQYIRHARKIEGIYKDFNNETLIVDTSYQRRSVWLERDRVRLIETILIGLIIPEVYFWDAETDPDTGKTITHIVDGQQRIKAITEFIDNNLKLSKEHLIDVNIRDKYGDKYFRDLNDRDKILIWRYELYIVQIKSSGVDEIKNVFYRLNLTEYALNAQEKRHSTSWGFFANLVKEISELPFWNNYKLFDYGDIRRMKDEEFYSTLILLARKGIINQTDQKPINNALIDYASDYPEYEQDKNRIIEWTRKFEKIYSEANRSFLQKRTQLYTIFCLMNYFTEENIEINDIITNKISEFIYKYNQFKNSSETKINVNVEEEAIRKYKLASSEGVNKIKNRMVRFEIIKNYVLNPVRN